MRFRADGPIIPDTLLEQCDQGRVVFLCGAGVSMRSGLPSFIELTQHVIEQFDPDKGSPVTKSFKLSEDGKLDPSSETLDTIFGLLYHEYGQEDVHEIVAEHLHKLTPCRQSRAHDIVARISSDSKGRPQIVTTNFDRLFDRHPKVKNKFLPPAFPDIALDMPIRGVTYMHGRLKKPGKRRHRYILSNSDFGQAYLSEGWATKFVKALLEKYTVVLLGYQAKDPPVRYLLQGLNLGRGDSINLYAFDEGSHKEVEDNWRGLGVTTIAYKHSMKHQVLWDTLESWADRADQPGAWREKVLGLARLGPRALSSHERGQVTHLVRTTSGARLFAKSEPSPTPEWLCVFDASCRMTRPVYDPESLEAFEPTTAYGLDDDPSHLLEIKQQKSLDQDHLSGWRKEKTSPAKFRSSAKHHREDWPNISPRLLHLMDWSMKHLNNPCTAWWIARQDELHPNYMYAIAQKLSSISNIHPKARDVWDLIHKAMTNKHNSGWDHFANKIENAAWTENTLRAFEDATKPMFTRVHPRELKELMPPPESWNDIDIQDILRREVKLPTFRGREPEIPDKYLVRVFDIAERHLIQAAELRCSIGTHTIRTPIYYSGRDDASYFEWFLILTSRMLKKKPTELKQRVLRWSEKDQFFFRKLKLIVLNRAAMKSVLFDADEIANILLKFDRDDLYDFDVRRELLPLLVHLGANISARKRNTIVGRLLEGPMKLEHWTGPEYPDLQCSAAAVYVKWLELNGLRLTRTQLTHLTKLISNTPNFTNRSVSNLVALRRHNKKRQQLDSDPKSLADVPVNEIAERATAGGKLAYRLRRTNKPFQELVTSNLRKALLALLYAARRGNYEQNLWGTLIENWPEGVNPRTRQVFMRRIVDLPLDTLHAVSRPLSLWINKEFSTLYSANPESAWAFFDAVVTGFLTYRPSTHGSPIPNRSNGRRSRLMASVMGRRASKKPIETMIGGWCEALESLNLPQGDGIPDDFRIRLERLLSYPGTCSDDTTSAISQHVHQLHKLDPTWVIKRVIPWFDLKHQSANPAWHGYLHGKESPPPEVRKKIIPSLPNIFSHIYEWRWDRETITLATEMVVKLTVFRQNKSDGLTQKEARHCIREMNEFAHLSAIACLRDIGKSKGNGWNNYVVPFIRNIWPRERSYKVERLVPAWLDLLHESGDDFPHVLEGVLRFLVPMEHNDYELEPFIQRDESGESLTTEHPKSVLDMLDTIVPHDPEFLPVELELILETVKSTSPNLEKDSKFNRLINLVEQQ